MVSREERGTDDRHDPARRPPLTPGAGSLRLRLRRSFTIGAVLITLPILCSAIIGARVLVARGEGVLLLALSACSISAGLLIVRRAVRAVLRIEEHFLSGRTQDAELHWGEPARRTWEAVTAQAEAIRTGRRPCGDLDAVKRELEELARTVSAKLHPRSDIPLLEFTPGDLALAAEQAVRELRELFVEKIPLHGEIRVADVVRGRATWEQAQGAFDLYRMIRVALNPLGALLGEIQGVLSRRLAGELSEETTRWAAATAVELLGRHLVSLYAGEVLERAADRPPGAPGAVTTEAGALSILIIGETKAGKSSLANALFGTELSPTSPLPETQGIGARKATIEGLGEVTVYDTPGYDAGAESGRVLAQLFERSGKVELLVLVTAATSPARAADRSLLDKVRQSPAAPQILVALTKIDLLRPFGRWNPPYDVEDPAAHSDEPDRLKAEAIRGAILTTAEQLGVAPERVVPVMVRTVDESYNMDLFAAVAADLLPSLRRALFRRTLREQKDERFWSSLTEGLRESGRFVVRRGVDYALKQVRPKE